MTLVAPYCAIPRDYLSDTPLLRAMGFLVSQWPVGCPTPPPFLSVFPLGEHVKWRCDTSPTQSCSDPMKTRQTRAIPPLCDTISKGYCAIWGGGISHWATKLMTSQGVSKYILEYGSKQYECDSDTRIVRGKRPAKQAKNRPCEARVSVFRNSAATGEMKEQNLAIHGSNMHWVDIDGYRAKLVRRGIASEPAAATLLGWHFCRAKLAQNIFVEFSYEQML